MKYEVNIEIIYERLIRLEAEVAILQIAVEKLKKRDPDKLAQFEISTIKGSSDIAAIIARLNLDNT